MAWSVLNLFSTESNKRFFKTRFKTSGSVKAQKKLLNTSTTADVTRSPLHGVCGCADDSANSRNKPPI